MDRDQKQQPRVVPAGDMARKALKLDEDIPKFFPPVSPISYGFPTPWIAGQPKSDRKPSPGPRPIPATFL